MRTLNFLIVVLFVTILGINSVQAQKTDKNKKAEEKSIMFKTSATCESCKEAIEKAMAYEKGVKKSELNLDNKVVTIWYNEKKTSPEKIKKAIVDAGYEANLVTCNEMTTTEEHGCCSKHEHSHDNH